MKAGPIALAAGCTAALVAAWGFWEFAFCRFYVAPNEMAVIIAKSGQPLPPGQLLAKPGQRGVQEMVLAEGRHFLNPVEYDHRIVPAVLIPAGKIGIVTSKIGTDLQAGEFLADAGQKGIWRRVLGPGKYRLNPEGYNIDVIDALSVPIGYVGTVTSLSGTQAPQGDFAKAGQKGVREEILQPGLYYVNPHEFKIDVVEVGLNQVTLSANRGAGVISKRQIASSNNALDSLDEKVLANQQQERRAYFDADKSAKPSSSSSSSESANDGAYSSLGDWNRPHPLASAVKPRSEPRKTAPASPAQSGYLLNQSVQFPSRDGFAITLDMSVDFELLPENIAWVFRNYGDLPVAVDKVLMPQILSVVRLKGSMYGARDFIVGEARQQFQTDLKDTLARVLAEKKIIIHNALIRAVSVPQQILDPIQTASIAVEQDLTNQEKQNTAKKQAELNTETSLIDQRGQEVAQETQKLEAEIKATQAKEVAEIGAETLRQVADIQQKTAAVRAEKTTTLGKAEADVTRMVEGERANGFQLKIKAFGDPAAYNLWTFASALDDNIILNILHSGPGTLWTDLQKAGLGEIGGAKVIQQAQKSGDR